MQNVIKGKSTSYKRYEELLLKKEALLKEAEKYRFLYEQIFGSLNKEISDFRLECVRKRKIISYCKNIVELGLTIYRKELDSFVENAMKDYQETIACLLDDENNEISEKPASSKELKTIYRKIAKLIHPDMNVQLKNDSIIQDLWNRTCIAYNCANFKDLQELEVLVNKYLDTIFYDHPDDIEIPNIEEKIFNLYKEIEKIKNTNPYQYKYILNDEANVVIKIEELSKEVNDYKRYNENLDNQIKQYDLIIEDEKDA